MDLERISAVLQSYTGQEDSMHEVVQVLDEELGENWVQTVFQDLQALSPALKENLTHAYNYYAATTAWNETQEYLMNANLQRTPDMENRMPILKHWLDFFGAAGQAAYQELENRLNELPAVESEMQAPELSEQEDSEEVLPEQMPISEEPVQAQAYMPQEEVVEPSDAFMAQEMQQGHLDGMSQALPEESTESQEEQPLNADDLPQYKKAEIKEKTPAEFELEKIQNQIKLLDQNQAWLAARCIQLDDIEIYAYPFYGFMVDLLRQTLKNMKKAEETPEINEMIDTLYAGGREAFNNKKEAIQSDIEKAEQNCESATTALIDEDIDMDEVRRTLGTIDTRDNVEYVGPAPDGFELLDDAPLDETTIKKQYEQLEKIDALTGEAAPKQENVTVVQENASQNEQKGVQQRKLSFSLKRPKPTE